MTRCLILMAALAFSVSGCKSIPNPIENRDKPAPAEFATAAPNGENSPFTP